MSATKLKVTYKIIRKTVNNLQTYISENVKDYR